MKQISAGFAIALSCTSAIAQSTFLPHDICNTEQVSMTPAVPTAANIGRTRAEVLQELIEARREGLAPGGRQDWPPTPRSIAWNKARFQARERWHAAHQKAAP
jgi:hypothetical protein